MLMKITKNLFPASVLLALAIISIYLSERQLLGTEVALRDTDKQINVVRIANGISSYAKRAEGHLLMYLTVGNREDRDKFFKRHASIIQLTEEITPLLTSDHQHAHAISIEANAQEMLTLGAAIIEKIDQGKDIIDDLDELKAFHASSSTIRKVGVLLVEETTKVLAQHNANFNNEHKAIHYILLFSLILSFIAMFVLYVYFMKFYAQKEKALRATSQLEQALESEKKYSALQQNFVSLVSHEFRTPLTIIDSLAQRIMRTKNDITPDQLVERGEKIRRAIERMVGLIEVTLYASRLDAGKIEIHPAPCVLKDIVQEVCEHHAEISPSHDIHLELDGLPAHINGDAKLLEHVFTNLMSNAIKYTPNAPLIEVRGWTEGGQAVVSVKDCGIGVSEKDLPHMFERYFRAKTAEGIKGTGIGLSVCKEFVKMHGGSVEVDSVLGEGSTFTVWLPIGADDQRN